MMKAALVCGVQVEPLEPEDRPYPPKLEAPPPAVDMVCPKCGHGEILIELRVTVVVPFQKKVRVDKARQIRKACCAACGFNIRELVAIS